MPTIWGKYKDQPVEEIDSADTLGEAQCMLATYTLAFKAVPGQHEHGNWKLWIGKKYPIPREERCE